MRTAAKVKIMVWRSCRQARSATATVWQQFERIPADIIAQTVVDEAEEERDSQPCTDFLVLSGFVTPPS